MKRIMRFKCNGKIECDDWDVTKEKGQGYAENNICYFRSDYQNRENFQEMLDEMCEKCKQEVNYSDY